jgi:hypothetical protein
MPALFGPVLTNAPSADAFLQHYRTTRASAAKVITAWGLDSGWTPQARRHVVEAVPNLIVRTAAGDPSYPRALWYLDPRVVLDELAPWLALRPNLWVELGNEPDVRAGDEGDIWRYNYWLSAAITSVRARWPRARLIGPAVRIGHPGWERWYEILWPELARCTSIGIHLYGFHRLLCREDEDTGQFVKALRLVQRFFPRHTVAVTELGIHDPAMPAAEKLRRYREFARVAPPRWTWALYYHHAADRAIQPEYHIP